MCTSSPRAGRPAFDPETIDPLDPSTLPSAQESETGYAGGGPFAAAGFYLTERPHIDAFRRAVAADPKGWAAVEKALAAKGLPLEPGEPTKRMPKGFEGPCGHDARAGPEAHPLARSPSADRGRDRRRRTARTHRRLRGRHAAAADVRLEGAARGADRAVSRRLTSGHASQSAVKTAGAEFSTTRPPAIHRQGGDQGRPSCPRP